MRLYKKIDIFGRMEHQGTVYLCSTNQSKTCRAAVDTFLKAPCGSTYTRNDVFARFARD